MEYDEMQFVAHGLLVQDGQALLLRRGQGRYEGGLWDIPGGTVEVGETPAEAAVREFQEEAGLQVRVINELVSRENIDTHGRPILFVTVTFLVELLDVTTAPAPAVVISHEHDAYKWIDLSQVAHFSLVPHVLPAIEAYKQTI